MVTGRPFLTAHWRNLLMVNFGVAPELLAPLVPAGTTLDTHQGHTYVSLVAFQFLDTRVLGSPIPLHRDFEELNLRFYVRREVGPELRRAVVFIKEVVPRRAIALVARVFYNEPYVALPMRGAVSGSPPHVTYQWRINGVWQSLGAQALGVGVVPPPESHEAFITEHYWGYTRQRNRRTLEYRVEHPPWTVWSAELDALPHLADLYGAQLSDALGKPASVLVAEGSAVSVMRGALIH